MIKVFYFFSCFGFSGPELQELIYKQTTRFNCPKRCLTTNAIGEELSLPEACSRLQECHAEFDGMKYDERVNYMITKLQGMVNGVSKCGYTNVDYCVGERGNQNFKKNICRQCFRSAYNIGKGRFYESIRYD